VRGGAGSGWGGEGEGGRRGFLWRVTTRDTTSPRALSPSPRGRGKGGGMEVGLLVTPPPTSPAESLHGTVMSARPCASRLRDSLKGKGLVLDSDDDDT